MRLKNNIGAACALIISVIGFAGSAAAADIIGGFGNIFVSGVGERSDVGAGPSGAPRFVADNFQLNLPGLNQITDVHWQGFYSSAVGADDFTIEFYASTPDGTLPAGSALRSYAVGGAVNRTDTGIDIDGRDLFSYSIDIAPLVLAADTDFYISIFNSVAGTDWLWGGLNGDANAAQSTDRANWSGLGGYFANFYLTGSAPSVIPVPAPGALALLALGLLGLACTRRRRRSS